MAQTGMPTGSVEEPWPGRMLDEAAFARVPLAREPFDHLVVPGFVTPAACAAARADFPDSERGGLAPAPAADESDGIGRLLHALHDPRLTWLFGEKFGLDLDPAALMITLRSRCRAQDGRIHTDSENKVVTALIYLNETWPHAGGRLRLLRGPDDLDDMIAEVPPLDGTLIAFRRSDKSFHGHYPFEGVRRAIMLNWMTSPAVAWLELRRHAVSAGMKRFLPRVAAGFSA